MICVAVAAATNSEMLDAVQKGRHVADVVELRVDGLSEPQLSPLIAAARPKRVIVTNRSAREGGFFHGSEKDRIAVLYEAVSLGADYVDLEWQTPAPLRGEMLSRKRTTKVIFSYHDFTRTPTKRHLLHRLRAMREGGADIAKIVTMAQSPEDNLTVLSLLVQSQREHFPLIAFCMGETGKISRLATLALGGYMTYASLGDGKETAPGQISADTLRQIVEQMGLSLCA